MYPKFVCTLYRGANGKCYSSSEDYHKSQKLVEVFYLALNYMRALTQVYSIIRSNSNFNVI
jgi:hypothetical protein